MAAVKTLIGNIKGPKGDTGEKGDTGAKGDIGATGRRGSRWNSGTAITGTSTTATIFSGSGISDALVSDMYLNTSTGNTYRCTVSGAASVAKWVYVGNIKGTKGDTGAKGDKGDTGATGPRGPQGEYAAVDSALSTTSTNPVQNKVVQAALGGKLGTTGDTKNNVVSFTSADSTSPTAWTDVAVLASGEKHSSLFNKISTMFKNIRWLYKMLGTTDISGIGNGTVTGGLSALNSNLMNYIDNLQIASFDRSQRLIKVKSLPTNTNVEYFSFTSQKGEWVGIFSTLKPNDNMSSDALMSIMILDEFGQVFAKHQTNNDTNLKSATINVSFFARIGVTYKIVGVQLGNQKDFEGAVYSNVKWSEI